MTVDEFKKKISDICINIGFTLNDNELTLSRSLSQSNIVINGKPIQQAPINIQHILNFDGEGSVDDVPFEIISFSIYSNHDLTYAESLAINVDESGIIYFKQVLNQFINHY